MLRILLPGLLALSLAALGWADDPKPPWQRLLTGADAKKAADLGTRIAEAENADRYADALAATEELLALRTQAQGADHWQTAEVKWALVTLQKVAALPPEKRLGWRTAAQGDAEADRLEQRAQYAKAPPLRQQRLKWCREILGEDHPETATGYNNVAANLDGRLTAAEVLEFWRLDAELAIK